MIGLIMKDILFNLKWFLLFVAIAFFIPLIYIIDNETRLTLIVFILGPVFANSIFLPKSCYLDDNPQTKAFLLTLPIKKQILVGAKYAMGAFCIFCSVTLTSGSALLFGLGIRIQSLAIAVLYLLVYYAIFLGSFYKTNYSNAEKSNTALLFLAMFSMFYIDRSGIMLDTIVIEPSLLLSMLAGCMLLYLGSFIYSVHHYHK